MHLISWIDPLVINMENHMGQVRLEGCMSSWSTSTKYPAHHVVDPVDLVHDEPRKAWGEPNTMREVFWPLHLRVGRT